MEAATAGAPRRFDHLREHSIGLPQVLFQSITHMAPAAAVAYSIYISVPDARQRCRSDQVRGLGPDRVDGARRAAHALDRAHAAGAG
jgi:hypothetical protein